MLVGGLCALGIGLIASAFGLGQGICISNGIGCFAYPDWPLAIGGIILMLLGVSLFSAGLAIMRTRPR